MKSASRSATLFCTLLALVAPIVAEGQGPEGAPVDLSSALAEAVEESGLPAIGAAVFDSERLLALGVAGVRKAGTDVKVEPSDLWHIGSITKSFTSTLLGALVDDGRLSWETKLSELLPQQVQGSPYADVTVKWLASHRSGLPANLSLAEGVKIRTSGAPVPAQRLAAVSALFASEPVHAPGSAFLYSNGGYITLGAVVEKLAGKSWEELVREVVLGPLELTSAGFGPPGTAGALDQPLGHRLGSYGAYTGFNPGPWADNPPFLGPAGTLHMSIEDLAAYGREHLRGEMGKEAQLQTATFRTLHKAIGDDYALGWVVDVERDWQGERRVIWHNGSNTYWYAFLAIVPGSDLGVAVATNGSITGREAVEEVAAELFAEFNARTAEASVDPDP